MQPGKYKCTYSHLKVEFRGAPNCSPRTSAKYLKSYHTSTVALMFFMAPSVIIIVVFELMYDTKNLNCTISISCSFFPGIHWGGDKNLAPCRGRGHASKPKGIWPISVVIGTQKCSTSTIILNG